MRWALQKLGVDEWLNRTVMALYTEACTVVRTDAGLSEGWFASRVSTESTIVCCCHGCCFISNRRLFIIIGVYCELYLNT